MKNNATNVFSLCLLAISLAVPAASKAATPLVTQYIAPVGNPTWEARVMTGAYGTGGGIVFNQARTGDYYNYYVEISGNFYATWYCFVRFIGIDSTSFPNKLERSAYEKFSSPQQYLYPVTCTVPSGDQGGEWNWGDNKKQDINPVPGSVFNIKSQASYFQLDSQATPSGYHRAEYVQGVHTDWVYTVTFNANGGGGTMGSFTLTNSAALPANAFARAGYTFDRWDTVAGGGGDNYADGSTVSKDLVLYAQWKPIDYTVTLDRQGGSGGTSSTTATYGVKPADVVPPTRDGYSFGGYYTGTGGGGSMLYDYSGTSQGNWAIASDTTLYAKWTGHPYKVSFVKGESVTGEMGIQNFTYGVPQALNTNSFVRVGWTFIGWSTSNGGSVEYLDCAVVSNLTSVHNGTFELYARWAQGEFAVTFDKQDGEGGTDVTNATYEVMFPNIIPPTRAGCRFGGYWTEPKGVGTQYVDSNGNGIAAWNIASPLTLYANWIDITQTVTFYATEGVFEGVGSVLELSVFHPGKPFGDDMPIPVDPNTNRIFFAGWWTSTNPVDRVQVFETNIVDSATTNLYARWKAVAEVELCTLTFKLPDGSEYCKTNAAVGAEYGKYFPANPTHDGGYRFFGWYDSSGKRVSESDVVVGSAMLTERWTLGAFNDTWNCPDIAFSTNGVSGWTIDAETGIAQSGKLGDNGDDRETSLKVEFDKDGVLSFNWKISKTLKEDDGHTHLILEDELKNSIFSLDGSSVEDNWHEKSTNVTAESKYYFSYKRELLVDYEELDDCGWVSNLTFTAEATASTIDDWASVSSVTSAVPGAAWTTGGDKPWATTADADVAAAVDISDGRSSWVKLAVPARAGVLSFKWRTSGEAGYVDTNGVYQVCDYLEFFDENGEGLRIEGMSGDFAEVVWTNDVEAAHVFTWRYVKDGDVAEGEDGAWLRDVVWTPMGDDPEEPGVTVVDYEYEEGGEVKHGSVTVPNDWVDEYDLKAASGASDYLSALTSQSGKKGYGGADLCYWADYVAGTVPTNPASVFRVSEISVVDGTVRISWDPDWSDPAGPLVRQYTVWGKTNLTDSAWHTPTNSASRFFRVEVDLPKQ